MKNILLLLMLLGLGLSSCKKDENNPIQTEMVEVNGKSYSVEFLRNAMAKELNEPAKNLVFHKEELAFTVYNYPNTKWSIIRLIESLKL